MSDETPEGETPKEDMLALKKITCPICGGLTHVDYTITFEQCIPASIKVDPVIGPNIWLCPGHTIASYELTAESSQLDRVQSVYKEAIQLRQKLLSLMHHLDYKRHHELWEEANAANNSTILWLDRLRAKADA